MEERFPSSRENPRAAGPTSQRPVAPSITERFGAMLRDREEKLREATGEETVLTADDIVRCYEDVLSELTFNSKPVITDLTIIAGQHIRYAEEVADAICTRILEVAVDQKLPSLYLIDSIVKNIGHHYVRIFATRLPKVFCEAYNQVHPTQYSSMRHLFGTWSQVFPSKILKKIEDELQFSPSESKRSSGITSTRQSKPPSPHHSRGIHVNPKYLEARHQFEQSAVGIPHTSVSSSLHVYEQKPSKQYSESDFDLPELLPQDLGTSGAGPPQTAMVHVSSAIGAGGSMPHLKNKISLSSSPPRIGVRRHVSPPNMRFYNGISARKIGGMASPSHSGFVYGPGRVSDPNSRADRSRPSNEDPYHVEVSMQHNHKYGYGKQHPRDLIDAYGNPRGRVSSYEKFPKVQRLDVNGIASEAATRKWKNSDEEEYVWESMSPTLADQSRRNSLPPFGPSSGSISNRTGISISNPAMLETDFQRHSWPVQTQSHPGSMMKYLDGTTSQTGSPPHHQKLNRTRDSGKFSCLFPQSTRQSLSPRSRSTALALGGVAPSIGQKLPVAHDSLPDIELPLRSLSNAHDDPLKINTAVIDRQSTLRPYSPPQDMLPSAHKSQSLPCLSIPPNQKLVNGQLDISEPNKLLMNQGADPRIFVPEKQYDIVDKYSSESVKFIHFPYQPPSNTHLNQQSQVQGISMPMRTPETYGSILPPATALVSSYLIGQPVNHLQTLGTGVSVVSVLPCSSFATPSVTVHRTIDTSLHLHGSLLPPLPPGPRPASSQMGPTPQTMSSSISSSPASAYSGLIGSLMEQGLISLKPSVQSQETLGIEFDIELLKVRHESAINALYDDLPRKCATCGLRFKGQEEHSSHMDWHVTKNRISKNRKQKPSRKWYVSAKEWLSGAEILGNDVVPGFLPTESVSEKKEDIEVAVPADENQNVCALCGELFEDFYSDETEEWMYKGAVYLNAPDGYIEGLDRSQLGPIVHAKCRSESNECSVQA
uniref:CID domain-containing protein n=2 Tax=Musa acuminata subsp. malaccensis TaxID=214687 RepID=A0A804JIA4_MUSAM|nr:PREDICTED: polyadenylation and cleavage factor homolog 4-like isoform X1 [Musa acuminata subsp. malaccensis]